MQRSRQSGSRRREDKALQARYNFDSLSLESKNLGTAVLLIHDTDSNVVAQALSALDKYAVKAPENAANLLSLNVLPELLPLMEHAEIFVRRFATKLVAELSMLEDAKRLILRDPSKVPFLCDVLIKEIDVPLQEFSSATLAELTKVSSACEDVLETNVVDILFTRIKSHDPDVQNNSAKIMLNLLKDPEAAPAFLKSPAFEFTPIFQLLQSEYPAIQNVAIDVLDMLTSQHDNSRVVDALRQSKGLEDLMDILEMFDWKDLHPGILKVLQNVADNPKVVQHMSTTNFTRHLFQYMEDIHDGALIEKALDFLAKVATTDIGRKMLLDYNITDLLMRNIKDDNPGIARAACIGVANMMKNPRALEAFCNENPIREIMTIIKNETFPWETRHGGMLALCSILEKDKSFCDLILNLRQQDTLLHLLRMPPGKVPPEMLVTVLHCLALMAAFEDTREKILNSDIIVSFLNHLESKNAQLQMAACFSLSAFVCEKQVRDTFILNDGPSKLLNCLKSPYMPVRQAASSLVQLIALDPKVAEMFISVGALDWMKEQRETRVACPSWDTAIHTLFRSCLSAKFYYMYHLDMEDVTGDIFYVFKKPSKTFIVLEEVMAAKAIPLPITYVANLRASPPPTATTEKAKSKNQEAPKHNSVKAPEQQKGKYDSESDYEITFLDDTYLVDYVEQVKKLMKHTDNRYTRCTIPQKAVMLANFVASKMCGSSKGSPCNNHITNLHINELKIELSSTIIPLGFIRVGMHLERAILFKVLADQVGLPCALTRGDYGRTWVEIAVPQVETNDKIQPLNVEALPTRLLKPNYIVDLMDEPGKLYQIGSFDAAKYCSLPSSFL